MKTEKTRAEKLAIQKDYELRKCQIKLAKEKTSKKRWEFLAATYGWILNIIYLIHFYNKWNEN